MMDAETIRLRRMLSAARELGALMISGERMVDADGCPLPGSRLARLHLVLALYQGPQPVRRPGRN